MTRRLIILTAALFAIFISQAQILMGWGQSPAEFAADSDATLRVAGYAFSIWGVIYLGLLIYAVRQALPATPDSPLRDRLAWPSALALTGIGVWIVAAAYDWEIATIVLIFGSLLVLLLPMLSNARAIRALTLGDKERWLTVWPLAMLAGWLSIASPVNLITVATGNGWLPDILTPTAWAIGAIWLVALVAAFVTGWLRTQAFALPVVWGLGGVFVAEQTRNPELAYTAVLAGMAIVAASGMRMLARSRMLRRNG